MTDERWAWAEIDLGAIAHNVRDAQGAHPAGHAVHGRRQGRRLRARSGAGRARRARGGRRPPRRGDRGRGASRCAKRASRRRSTLLSEPPASTAADVVEHGLIPTLLHPRVRRARSGATPRRAGHDAPLPPQGRHRDEPHRRARRGRTAVRRHRSPSSRRSSSRAPSRTSRPPTSPATGTSTRQLRALPRRARGHADRGRRPRHRARREQPGDDPVSREPLRHGALRHRASTGCTRRSTRTGSVDLAPAMSVKARATLVKRIGDGRGRLLRPHVAGGVARPTIATLPLGYADGVHRVLSNTMEVLVGGRRCRAGRSRVHGPVHGRGAARRRRRAAGTSSCSSASRAPSASSMDEMAELAGTINYEIACAFGMRLPRVYR